MKPSILFLLVVSFFQANITLSQPKNGKIVHLVRLLNESHASENERIIKAFQQEFVLGDYYFFYPKDANAILRGDTTNRLMNADLQKKNLLSSVFKIYVITFGVGHPKDTLERYNYEGFSLHTLENQQFQNTGRYGGAPYSILSLGKYRDYKKGVRKLIRDILKDGL